MNILNIEITTAQYNKVIRTIKKDYSTKEWNSFNETKRKRLIKSFL